MKGYLLDILTGLIYWGVICLLAFFGAFLYGRGAYPLSCGFSLESWCYSSP